MDGNVAASNRVLFGGDWYGNSTNSLQLFVVEFDTCLVWELLLLPSNAQIAPNLSSLKGNIRKA